jgi:hypothetical protein
MLVILTPRGLLAGVRGTPVMEVCDGESAQVTHDQ